jgi:hypothetical protein
MVSRSSTRRHKTSSDDDVIQIRAWLCLEDTVTLRICVLLTIAAFVSSGVVNAQTVAEKDQLLWHWSYSAGGIHAEGTFTTTNVPQGDFYQIVGITGARNGVRITGLQPTGTAIPGNQGYPVDNLVSAAGMHLTNNGFAFALENGDSANVFNNPPNDEYLSAPPYPEGQGTETAVSFEALAAAPPSGRLCNGVYDGTFNGNITVSAEQNCTFANGGQITGNVRVAGGYFSLKGAAVGGNLTVEGGATVALGPAASIGGNLTIDGLSAGGAANLVCGTAVAGNLTVDSNMGSLRIGSHNPVICAGNKIGGNATLNNNSGPLDITGNSVAGNLACRNNSKLGLSGGNTAAQPIGQCN